MAGKKLLPTYLFMGPEIGLKQETIQSILATIKKQQGQEPEFFRYYAQDTEINDILSHLRNGSLFSPHKVVLLNNAESISKKNEIKALIDYVKKPSSEATLILVSDEIKVSKPLQSAFPKEAQKIFWELFDNQKTQWVRQFFQSRQHPVTQDAVDLILDLVENNTEQLRTDCGNLLHFLEKGAPVTEELVETYIFHSREENVFTLFEAFSCKDKEGALEILRKLLLSSGQDPVGIMAGFTWQLRRLHQGKILQKRGMNMSSIASQLFIRGKKNQKNMERGLRNYTLPHLEKVLAGCAAFDAHLRSGSKKVQEMILQIFLFKALTPSPEGSFEGRH